MPENVFGLMAWSVVPTTKGILVAFEGPRGKGQGLLDLESSTKLITKLVELRNGCWPDEKPMLLATNSELHRVANASAASGGLPIVITTHKAG